MENTVEDCEDSDTDSGVEDVELMDMDVYWFPSINLKRDVYNIIFSSSPFVLTLVGLVMAVED